MNVFRVLVHGRGMVVTRWWFFRRDVSFYATRFVTAADDATASVQALAAVRDEPRLLVSAVRPADLSVEEVEDLGASELPSDQPGIVFYRPERLEP